mgnify:CR=1 FL=1
MENLTLYSTTFSKQRIGKQFDGGYVIIDLPGEYDLFISGGVEKDISFEKDLLSLFPNLNCYAFDGTINSLPPNNIRKLKFIKKNLGNYNDEQTTNLYKYMKYFNNIFMKIDIEGHEFRLMPSIIENNFMNKIKQLVIEIHSPADIELFPDYFKGLSDIKNEDMFNLFKKINETHTLVHLHANNGCKMNTIEGINIPHVFELTYIRNEFISEKIKNKNQLPTPLDMPNIPSKIDYILKGFPYSNN